MEKDIYYLVGQNIKKQRKLKGLTQLQLANKTFFSYEFIRKIESKVLVEILFLWLHCLKLHQHLI